MTIRYEVYSMEAESKKSILRASYHFDWHYEPIKLIKTKLLKTASSKIQETFDYFWTEHLPASVEEYVREEEEAECEFTGSNNNGETDNSLT